MKTLLLCWCFVLVGCASATMNGADARDGAVQDSPADSGVVSDPDAVFHWPLNCLFGCADASPDVTDDEQLDASPDVTQNAGDASPDVPQDAGVSSPDVTPDVGSEVSPDVNLCPDPMYPMARMTTRGGACCHTYRDVCGGPLGFCNNAAGQWCESAYDCCVLR